MLDRARPTALATLTSPRMLALHGLGIVAVTIAVWAGIWQYGAWQTGRELAVRDLADTAPVALDTVLGPDAAFPGDQVGRPVDVRGTWLPDGTVQVTGRSLDGVDGRWVVTPVAVCDGGEDCDDASAVLVVRGFAAAGSDVPPPPTGPAELTGWLQPGEGRGLPDEDPTDDVLPELRIASAVQHVDRDLYGGYVIERVSGNAQRGLEPVTPAALPKPDSFTSLRNLFYSAEWFVFAGFAVFLWWRWVRDELERVAAATAEDEADQDVPAPEIASSP